MLCDASSARYCERIQDAYRGGRLAAVPEAQWQKLSHLLTVAYAYVAPPTLAAGWQVGAHRPGPRCGRGGARADGPRGQHPFGSLVGTHRCRFLNLPP